MKLVRFYAVMLLLVLFASCRKEEDPVPTPIEEPQPTFQLTNTPGSYWIYLVYTIDSTGAETQLGYRDSVYVAGDTTINGNSYIHYQGTWLGMQKDFILRDSAGFIVNNYGAILFNRVGFTDTVHSSNDGTYITHSMTASGLIPITVPALTVDCYDQQTHFYMANGTPISVCDSVWIKHTYYNFHTGEELISQIALANQLQAECKYMERRLAVAHIE